MDPAGFIHTCKLDFSSSFFNILQGDFHHWVDLFNHFDSFFEKHVKTRKDLQLDDDFMGEDTPFPREAVLQILRVVRIVLENCTNKHFYSSYEVCETCLLIFLLINSGLGTISCCWLCLPTFTPV